ncbi:MAG: hypothetical protein GAS50_10070 [Desulfobacterales bacterium]|jgi:hypothetical protein|nr:hypothetical protein [Desulfobacterales bacterium]
MAIMMTIPVAIVLENHVSSTDSVFFGKEKTKKSRMKDIIFLIVIVYAIRVVTSVIGMHEMYHLITPSFLLPTFFWIFPQAVISCFIVIVISGPAYVKIIQNWQKNILQS